MIRNTIITLTIMLSMLVLASCEDDFDYGYGEIPEGMGMVSAELTFEDYTPALESRASGTAVKDVNSLWMVVYNAGGEYIDHFKVTDFTSNGTEARPGHEETPTACLKFTHLLPNGRYKLYAVANYDLAGYSSEDLATEHQLRSLYSKWDNDPANIGDNAQMFGYFTPADQKDKMANQKNAKGQWNYEAQTVVVNGASSFHAWLRRSASKVTVAFDTRNLKDNVFIYIKSVRLRDLPKYCYIGRQNRPDSEEGCTNVDPTRYTNAEVPEFNDLESKGEAIYFGQAVESEKISEATVTKAYEHWLRLTNATMISGVWSDRNADQVTMPGDEITADEINERIRREHAQSVEALYFYENSQPDGEEGQMTDKRQDVTGNNANVSYENGVLEDNEAWKDARPYGTYVEVEGYYVSNDSIKPGVGAIKYRFMLGKDTKTNYDAERNHHYKLTMVFNGYANDVDFHIDFYNEGQPGSKTPPTVYVSYLYNQRHSLIAEATPRKGYKLSWVKAIVLDNEWRRANGDGDYNSEAWNQQINQTDYYATAPKPKAIEELEGFTEIRDAKIKNRLKIKTSADDDMHDVARNTEFGFLSLRNVNKVMYNLGGQKEDANVSQNEKIRIEAMIGNFRDLWFDPENFEVNAGGETHRSDVKGPRGFVTYDRIPQQPTPANGVTLEVKNKEGKGDGTLYTVHMKQTRPTANLAGNNVDFDRSYILSLPLYTRAKTLDTYAVYSGANPFYSHHRYARVRYIFHYEKDNNPDDWYEETSDTEVLQERRVDNPRGVFRTYNSTTPFHVQLAYIDQQKENDYIGLVPYNWELIRSNGPWTATIEVDPHNIVKLVKGTTSATGKGGQVKGSTGSYIDFSIVPNQQYNSDVSYGAVIEVKYHNNNCIHKIIVRQGLADVKLKEGGHEWATRNLYAGKVFTHSPISIGSLFKRRKDFTRIIKESNNTKEGFGILENVHPSNSAYQFDLMNADGSVFGTRMWYDISTTTGIRANAWGSTTIGGITYVVPDENIYRSEIIDNNDINFAFGCVYDVNATQTLLNANSFNFSEPANQEVNNSSKKGVRGVFAYSLTSGNNLFFPIGATGHGRRLADGLLHYGTYSGWNGSYTKFEPYMKGGTNNYRPMVYDLVWQLGGAYGYSSGNYNSTKGYTFLAMDINYSSYRVGNLDANSIYNGHVDGSSSDGHSSGMPLKVVRQ